jgi:hypothetical protein
MAHHFHCNDPNYCLYENSFGLDATSDSPKHREKIKVCMWQDTGDQDAQMPEHIKSLPEGEMKKGLLESLLKTMASEHKQKDPRVSFSTGTKPLFLDASFERNTKYFIKHNKETKVQHPSLNDLDKEVFYLKKEVAKIRLKINKYEETSEDSYKVDSWAHQ